ncbi:DEAD/DEAH box helicase [Nocardiopsis halotolerans]|uniref:DEAD/DEAH box helicase n=1 Tax=Nocardiopsis halotolerans TaxID=124252 RepID=UPI00034D4510|nr:DEAD/DEAH box helicase [Nocardiopsis halotolerans]
MTSTSPRSGCEPAPDGKRSGFELLDRSVQHWVWRRRWPSLRPVQERAVAPILAGDTDVIVTAATAGGKTEAAFLPICSALVAAGRRGTEDDGGVRALYVSPLKALINDQYQRLRDLCADLDIPVTPWHGDVAVNVKERLRSSPDGILLITPESLEALLVLNGSGAGRMFGALSHIVIDELHAFLGTNRGAQLRSLMARVEAAAGHRVARVGLSATLADLGGAAEYLRPGGGDRVVIVADEREGRQVRLQVRGYVGDLTEDRGAGAVSADVADHLYRTLRRGHNMVFANSRAGAEGYAALLAERAERDRIANPFLPHHGSLSAELRSRAEEHLKQRSTPATVVCTSTLELGIDVGWVDRVVQVGVPPDVAGLRQRLGRSGRGDDPARLLVYVTEQSRPRDPLGRLRTALVETVAIVDLLLRRWYEPPRLDSPDLSTLVQQILALVTQEHGTTAARLYRVLCSSGVFPGVDRDAFTALLRGMGGHGLLVQERGGLLLLGPEGERLVNHYSFYAAFTTVEEFEVVASGNRIGTIPVRPSLMAGTPLTFGGATWRVMEVDRTEARVLVEPASVGGPPPGFMGTESPVSDGVRARMREVYTSADSPAYLDEAARILLEESRSAFRDLGLHRSSAHAYEDGLCVFTWRGDVVIDTVCQLLRRYGVAASRAGCALLVSDATPERLAETAGRLLRDPRPEAVELAAEAQDRAVDRYDAYLPEALLNRAHAARALDVPGAFEVLAELADRTGV